MRIIKNLPQHLEDGEANPEWLAVRAGKFTGSDFHQYLSIVKKGELSDSAESALYEKVLESKGEIFERTKTEAMERGNELEETARSLYWAETGADVEEVGFVDYEQLRAGCSPDGIMYDVTGNIKKIIEIKCPELKNYLKMAKGKIPPVYQTQMQYNMLITGAKECDFIVFYPGMKLSIQTIQADPEYQKMILDALNRLNEKYVEIAEEIEEMTLK